MNMKRKFCLDLFLDESKNLTCLEGKRPIIPNWPNVRLAKEKLYNHNNNFGWVLDNEDLVIDVDPRNGGLDSYKRLLDDIGLSDNHMEISIKTPSGGFHIYLKKDKNYKFKKNYKNYKGIDFLSKGSQCVVIGNIDGNDYDLQLDNNGLLKITDIPLSLISVLERDSNDTVKYNTNTNNKQVVVTNNVDSNKYDNREILSESQVKLMLCKLSSDIDYNDWVSVGMALHSWNMYKGLPIYEDWSKNNVNYVTNETESKWVSFNENKGIDISYIRKLIKKYDKSSDLDKSYDKILESIDAVKNERELETDVIPAVKEIDFTKIKINLIANAIKDKYKSFKINLTTRVISQSLKKVEDFELKDWVFDYFYIKDLDSLYNVKTAVFSTRHSFNLENGYRVKSRKGGKISAFKYISDNSCVKVLKNIMYMPTSKDMIIEYDNDLYLNSFFSKKLNKFIKTDTPDERKLVIKNLVKSHIKNIVNTEENASIFLDWLTFQVQNIGEKISWCPLIHSIQGVGKSFFTRLLEVVLNNNIGIVNPTQVKNPFNGWAEGVLVNVLEELKVDGENRYAVTNALKPMISDKYIQINKKGINQYKVLNTVNYIAFTNNIDAIPLSDNERRYWVIYNNTTKKELDAINKGDYFKQLFEILSVHKQDIYNWLYKRKMKSELFNSKLVPKSKDKEVLVMLTKENIKGYIEIEDIIYDSNEHTPYSNEIIPIKFLRDTIRDQYIDLHVNDYQIINVLKKIGYKPAGRFTHGDEKLSIWIKGSDIDNNYIKNFIKERLQVTSN